MTIDSALYRAEADFEAALMACAMAVDSEGRKIILAPISYRGWQPDRHSVSAVELEVAFFRFVTQAGSRGEEEVERRWIVNARLILNAWEAALAYEALK